jgi:hypothetical protein
VRPSGLTGSRAGDQPRLPRGLGARLDLEHEPTVLLAVADGAQLYLQVGKPDRFNLAAGSSRTAVPARPQADAHNLRL